MQLFMRFGLPRVITYDQRREFNNSLDSKLMDMLGIETTPYHTQVRSGNKRARFLGIFMYMYAFLCYVGKWIG